MTDLTLKQLERAMRKLQLAALDAGVSVAALTDVQRLREGQRRRAWLTRYGDSSRRRRARPWAKYAVRGAQRAPLSVPEQIEQVAATGRMRAWFENMLLQKMGFKPKIADVEIKEEK